MDFQVELWLLIAKFFPSFADLPCLLLVRFLGRTPCDNCAGTKRSPGTKDAIPQIVCGNHSEADGLASLFGHGKRLGEELLLYAAEKLVGLEFVFARSRSPQEPDMEHDNIAAPWLNAIQHVSKMIERVVIAYRNENVAGARSHRFRSQFRFQLEIELVHLDMGRAAVPA